MVLHYFIETDNDLTQKVVGTSKAANGPRALVLFADKRYGKDQYSMRNGYIVAKDGRCLECRPFPPIFS